MTRSIEGLADAQRLTVQSLDIAIDVIRRKIRRGKYCHGRRYLELVRQAYDLRAEGVERGLTGPVFEDLTPIPYRTGFVGYTADQVRSMEWKGAGDFWGGRTVEARRIAA